MRSPVSALSTCYLSFFCTGFAAPVEGTLASAASLPFIVSLGSVLPEGNAPRALMLIAIALGLSGMGVLAMQVNPRVPAKDPDQPFIVIDEVAGMVVALLPVLLMETYTWQHVLAAFLLFRFFDIVKPLGIGTIDRMKTLWSVMLDDLLAGFYSAAILSAVVFAF